MEMSDAERHGLLKDEYLFLQNQYEDFDKRSLTIKGWIGSGSVAALAIAFGDKAQGAVIIPVFTAIISLVVWYHEATWKLFQHSLDYRIRTIEAYFREDPDRIDTNPPIPLQAYHSWFRSFTDDPAIFHYEVPAKTVGELSEAERKRLLVRRLFHEARQPFVFTLYVTIIVLSLVSVAFLHQTPLGHG